MNKLFRCVAIAGLASGVISAVSGTVAAEPLTPRAALERAMAHSPSLAAAVLEVRRAVLSVHAEDDRYVPSLTADVGYLHTASPSLRAEDVSVTQGDNLSVGVGVAHVLPFGTALGAELKLNGSGSQFAQPDLDQTITLGPTYGVSLRLTATQPLLRGFGRDVGEAALRRARAGRTAAEVGRERAASEAAREVLTTYWELWYARMAETIQERALALAQTRLSDAEVREEAGQLAPLDLLPLMTELASIRESLETARGVTRQRQVALARVVGGSITARGDEALTPAAAAPALAPTTQGADQVAAAARESAYELLELQTAITQARVNAEVADDTALSRLDLSAWVGLEGLGDRSIGDAFEMFGTGVAVSGYIGLALELPIVNGARQAEAERARLAVKSAQARLQAATERVTAQALDSLEALRSAETRQTYAEATRVLAARSVEGQQARFDAGAATATELVVAGQELRRVELRVARAQADVAQAHAQLQHQTGRLLAEISLVPGT